ncbi:uncharacterized protein LACBIDRAFT_292609 [Laccaria bicolor S238N-H82]|uniref:Predicted protein n=1 Tax=Laccaria bicolor (strain S238N-H82 / ATCC MYA-4686) TaxID=486041 RepID=B0CVU6_LACBS|nr:uncharacterized protein LACBIDRAFT_292609 [Laccaria bicolor S238N-H82]EDR13807.1 predicted protein [Laccaria bicolor S238N-H82]|eukprot:XP_001876305.1 predicted protein [Laccaria bicolor S238N-H82]
MQFDDYSLGEPDAWGAVSPQAGDIVRDAMMKEKVIKEILSCQDDLRVMLGRVDTVQKEVDKLVSENETLQMYIDNLTVQMAKRR